MHGHLNVKLSRCTVTWTSNYHDARSPERQIITMHGHLNVKFKRGQHKVYWPHVKVKCSRYRPGVAQSVGRGIALLFHDHGTRGGWVVSSTPRPHFTPGKDPVPILQETGWVPGPVWKGGKSGPHWDSIPDRPARIQSLFWLSYPAHLLTTCNTLNDKSWTPTHSQL